uniref:Uncharacterized protein LOC112823440 isoform X2 n=1 Tax=Callorhinus ursinus TaxID=34884 RepID=A0A3Q7NZW3_CALUR|nr:uncharacterized protein LOC112823440 isoform X2 [Callorhinus ursinus]
MRGARAIALSDRAVGEWRREQRGGEAVKRDPPLGPSPALRALAMAPLLTLFLVALVGLPLAQALDCHVCAYNGENCFNPMRCPAMVTYCMTTRTYYTPTKMKGDLAHLRGSSGSKALPQSAHCKHSASTLQGVNHYHTPITVSSVGSYNSGCLEVTTPVTEPQLSH